MDSPRPRPRPAQLVAVGGSAQGPHCAASVHGCFPSCLRWCHLRSLMKSLSFFVPPKTPTSSPPPVRDLRGVHAQASFRIWTFGFISLAYITEKDLVSLAHLLQAELRSGLALGGPTTWASLPSFHNELISPRVQLLGRVTPPLCSLSLPTRGEETQLSFIDHLCYAHISL